MLFRSFDPSPLLAWAHIYTFHINNNLLPVLGLANPLSAGSYTFWINETDQSAQYSYAFDFQVSSLPAVPEPSVPAMLGLGIALLLAVTALRRRRAKQRRWG